MNKTSILKRVLIAGLLFASASSAFAADVGVSISVGQPGFYGQIDIGDYPYPQPRVIYREPIIVHRHVVDVYEPMYLRVPPGHYKNWKRYCNRYHACGRPVYFVQDRWYRDDFAPRYRERHRGHGDYDDYGYDRRYDRGGRDYYDRDDRGNYDRGGRDRHDDHKHGNGHGHGKGKDKDRH